MIWLRLKRSRMFSLNFITPYKIKSPYTKIKKKYIHVLDNTWTRYLHIIYTVSIEGSCSDVVHWNIGAVRPQILIFDCHDFHHHVKLITAARENQITLVESSNWLQPFDRWNLGCCVIFVYARDDSTYGIYVDINFCSYEVKVAEKDGWVNGRDGMYN